MMESMEDAARFLDSLPKSFPVHLQAVVGTAGSKPELKSSCYIEATPLEDEYQRDLQLLVGNGVVLCSSARATRAGIKRNKKNKSTTASMVNKDGGVASIVVVPPQPCTSMAIWSPVGMEVEEDSDGEFEDAAPRRANGKKRGRRTIQEDPPSDEQDKLRITDPSDRLDSPSFMQLEDSQDTIPAQTPQHSRRNVTDPSDRWVEQLLPSVEMNTAVDSANLEAELGEPASDPQDSDSFPREPLPALTALRNYSILVDDCNPDGPDYVPWEWDVDLLIQDIPWSELSLVCALGRPLDFIPTSHVQRVRRAFIHCLQAVVANPNDDMLWKRVCLLPTILFIDVNKGRRADLDAKIELILADIWPFKVRDFPGRMAKPEPVKVSGAQIRDPRSAAAAAGATVIGSDRDPDKRRLEYFKKLMVKGEVSKAFRAIVSDAKVLPHSPAGLEFLQSKHPNARPGSSPWSPADTAMEVEPIAISFESVVSLIRSSSKGSSCGVDNFPIDILKQLAKTLVKKEFPVDTRLFLDLLTDFFNRVFTFGQCPAGVLAFYDAGELIRLMQGASKIRPIGKATTFRKIVDVAQQQPHRQELQSEFGEVQFCGAAFGTERMQNAMNIHLCVHPGLTYSSSDFADAYCNVDRSKILSAVARVMPAALQPIQRRLAAVQDVIYYGNEAGPDTIKQAVGLTQGQATSGQLYSLGIQPLNQEISEIANRHPYALLSAYIDDVKTHTSAALVEEIIAHQLSQGPAYGALLKMEKHRILLESCSTVEDALDLQSHFHRRFRIPLSRILIHPSNVADPAAHAEARLLYGDVILGIPASPFPEYIEAFVEGEILRLSAEWRLASSRLKDEPHYLWYLLKHILASKFTYLFRGIAPQYSKPLADCLTTLHRETCEILAQSETIPDLSFDLARIREGAGLGFADDIPECAFAASKIASLRSIETANRGYLENVQLAFARGSELLEDPEIPLPARQLASALLAVDPDFLISDYSDREYGELRKLQGRFLRSRSELRTAAVEVNLQANNVHNTIYQSGKSPEARAWLDAVPKTEALTMSPSEFRTAFRNRLLIPHPQLLAHSVCSCGKDVDPFGIHMQKCRLDGNLTNSTHNRLVGCLAEMIRSCGQSVKVEVSGIFNNVDAASHQRMDLVVFDPGRPNLLYDVVVTNPVTAEVVRSNAVNVQATARQQQTKERRYRDAATAAGMLLHGLAIEVYGKWGDDFTDMFNHFISLGSVITSIPKAILGNYWRRRISVCLQSGIANAVNTRTNRLTARTLNLGPQEGHGEAFYPGVVEEQSEVYRDGALLGWSEEEGWG